MLIVNDTILFSGNPPDQRQSGTSTMRTHSSWSRSTRGQWNGSVQLGIASR